MRTPLEPWVFERAAAHDADGLRAYQLRALRETVTLARGRSRFYAELLRDVEPGALASLDDLSRLPLTTAEDIREHGMRLLCVRPGEVDRIVTLPTSGTTGEPKRIHFTAADQELTRDFFHRGMSVLVRPGQRVLILLPGERPGSVGDLLRAGLARMDVEGIVHGPVTDPSRALRAMGKGGFDAVVGIPVQVLGLARHGANDGVPIGLSSVLLSTDQAPRSLVAAVEEAWGCRVFDHYGTTEMGLGGGVECEALNGYHLREADLLFEIVDFGTGRPVPDGEYGEVVFTTLTREAMPFIRYRTGDRGRFLTDPCPCGTCLRRLERVRARLAGRARLGTGAMLDLADLDEVLFALPQVLDLRAALRRDDGRHDVLDVEVLAPGGDAGLLHAAQAALAEAPVLAAALSSGGLRLDVAVGSVPWSQGTGTVKRTLVQS
jgi:phenylacetate-coenzyme A ligase PaaK-like adenylate-forming protein